MKKIFTFLMTFMVVIAAYSREVTGKVVDENNSPLDYVNVVLYRDSIYITGTVTDEEGLFTISTEVAGNLKAKVSYLGYETSECIVPTSGYLGIISLTPATVELGEVVVRATRPSTTMKGNVLVTNVENTSLSIAGTANDVLSRVPMVVNNGGTLEVFGKGSPAIYVNGRKINDLQELSQLNSQDIKNVSVITNPGASYAANVKSVILIRTKPPKGDGFSGTLRTDNGFQCYFRTGNSLDLKYRTGGFELFTNYGWWRGNNREDRSNDMTTITSAGTYNQSFRTVGKESYHDMTGKIGFSFMFNEKHSIGAYYQNSWNRHHINGIIPSEVWQDGVLLERYNSDVDNSSTALPRHNVNLYYNGTVGNFNLDFNADYLLYKSRGLSLSDELSENGEERTVITTSINRNRMFAEKLVVSHSLWQGQISFGEEYTNTRAKNLFTANIHDIHDSDNRVDESNIATFAEFEHQFGCFEVGVGLRYEHVKFDYYEMKEHRDGQSKKYNNLFPSLNVATQVGNVRMGLNYSSKTVRPGYGQLDGTISYINRLTYETGNPYLKPTKMQTVEYMAQWRQFFSQVSYTYFKDGVYYITEPYGTDEEATIIRTANLDHRHYLQAFVGGQFKVGIWSPRVNIGMMNQWLTLPVDGKPMDMNTPGFIFQWQNAIHLPQDIWLNIDAQLMTSSWDNNVKQSNTPWYVNAKIYKGFFNNAFSITFEAKDLFNKSHSNSILYSNSVQIAQKNFAQVRSVMLTLQYRFNTTRDRYRGTGAGNDEKLRF